MGSVRATAGITGAVMGLLAVLTFSAGPGVDLAVAAPTPGRSVGA